MSVRFFYVDESYDSNRFCLSAICIRHIEWRECFERVRTHRKTLKQDHGIYLRKEVHAHEFVSGRGRIAPAVIGKHSRSRIYEGLLRLVAQLPGVKVFNVCLDVAGRVDPQLDAWDRLLNRIERTMLAYEERELPRRREMVERLPQDYPDTERRGLEERLNAYRPRAVVFADQGREIEITRVVRKMGTFNPIPSQFGTWRDGSSAQNILCSAS